MGEIDWGGNWVLFWWVGPCSLIQFSLFPPCCLTWGQTMVEVRKIMATSFKTSHACTAALSAPTLQQATTQACTRASWTLPGKSGQSLGGPLLLSIGSWCTQVFVCALQESVSWVLCKFWWLSGGVNGNLVQEGLCRTQVCCTQSLCLCSRPRLTHTSTGDTQHSSVSVSAESLGPGAHKVCLSPPSVSGWYGVWFQMWFCPSYHLSGDSLCPWTWGYLFLVGSNILLSTVVQQQVVILEFSQEKMSASASTLPSPSATLQTLRTAILLCYSYRNWDNSIHIINI